MDRRFLRVVAPFAAFRPLVAGVYRPSAPTITPSAAWGLVLNLAGIETRSTGGSTTGVRSDAPRLRLAIGDLASATKAQLYQQLHTYPVGKSGQALSERTHGAKYWIAPAVREVLVGLDCVIGIEAEDAILFAVDEAVAGRPTRPRYGLPFAGDNSFLLDRLEVLMAAPAALWYVPLSLTDGPKPGSCRLTLGIDRSDPAGTRSDVFAPSEGDGPPASAWSWVPSLP